MSLSLKNRYFTAATEVSKWVNDGANNVGTVVSIIYDPQSSQYVLFYYPS